MYRWKVGLPVLLLQRFQQCLVVLEVRRVKALREPVENRLEELPCLSPLTRLRPQPAQTECLLERLYSLAGYGLLPRLATVHQGLLCIAP